MNSLRFLKQLLTQFKKCHCFFKSIIVIDNFVLLALKERHFKRKKAKNMDSSIFRDNSMKCLVLKRQFFTMKKKKPPQFKDTSGMLLLRETPLSDTNTSLSRDNK